MPKRISRSPMPRGSGPAGTWRGAVAAFAAVARRRTRDRSRSTGSVRRSIVRDRPAAGPRMQSSRPAVTVARPSVTLRSNTCVRSERSASFAEASRITTANLSTTAWMRGRAMSRQARAEPITGPTRIARSRTMSVLSPAAGAACDTEQHGADQQQDPVGGHGKLRENEIDRKSVLRHCLLPPSGCLAGALWRGRIRLLAPLHELIEQLRCPARTLPDCARPASPRPRFPWSSLSAGWSAQLPSRRTGTARS